MLRKLLLIMGLLMLGCNSVHAAWYNPSTWNISGKIQAAAVWMGIRSAYRPDAEDAARPAQPSLFARVKSWFSRSSDFSDLSKELAKNEIARLREKLQSNSNGIHNNESVLRSELTHKNVELENLRKSVIELGATLQSVQASHEQFDNRIADVEKQKFEADSKTTEYKARLDAAEKTNENLNAKIAASIATYQDALKKNEEKKEYLQATIANLSDERLKERKENTTLREQIGVEMQKVMIRAQNLAAQLEKEKQCTEIAIKNRVQIQNELDEMKKKSAKMAAVTDSLNSITKECAEYKNKNEQIKKDWIIESDTLKLDFYLASLIMKRSANKEKNFHSQQGFTLYDIFVSIMKDKNLDLKARNYLVEKMVSIDRNLVKTAESLLGMTPFIVACSYGDKPVAQLLLNHGASINEKAKNGMTGVMVAASGLHADLVNWLIEEKKADFTQILPTTGSIITVILSNLATVKAEHKLSENELADRVISLLNYLNSKCDPMKLKEILNAKNAQQYTALHFATAKEDKKITEALKRLGADRAIQGFAGKAAEQLTNNADIVGVLTVNSCADPIIPLDGSYTGAPPQEILNGLVRTLSPENRSADNSSSLK